MNDNDQFLDLTTTEDPELKAWAEWFYGPQQPPETKKRREPSGWQKTRLRIFERDGHRCTYCGSEGPLECDHVKPVALGGKHDDSNLTTSCQNCNRRKKHRTPAQWEEMRNGK